MAQASRGRQARRMVAMRPRRKFTPKSFLPHPSAQWPGLRLAAPWFTLAGILTLIGFSLMVAAALAAKTRHQALTDTLTPIGAMLFATSSAPLVLGMVRLLAQPTIQKNQRCGLCQHYRASSTSYASGHCALERQRRPTTREASCDRFSFSERAMVRDRLSEAPHILGSVPKQHEH